MKLPDSFVVRLGQFQRDLVLLGVIIRVDPVFRRQHIVRVEVLVDILGDDQHCPPSLSPERVLTYFLTLELFLFVGVLADPRRALPIVRSCAFPTAIGLMDHWLSSIDFQSVISCVYVSLVWVTRRFQEERHGRCKVYDWQEYFVGVCESGMGFGLCI